MSGQAMKSRVPGPVEWADDTHHAGSFTETGRFNSLYAENQRLRLRNQTLETIAYVLSHDLRSPLRAIEGFSKALLEDLGESLPATAARNVREIHSGVERMQVMIAHWLAFIRTGQPVVHHERVNLSVLAYSVITELYAAEPKRSVVVYIEPDLLAHGDPVLLRQLLQNLLGNAWKFTRNQDERAVIAFGAISNGETTTYFVRDNGVGFDAADAQKLFAPFTRLEQARKIDGSGVGLAIARSIIDSHGGRIWAEGQPGAGAKFCFSLPPASPDVSAAQSDVSWNSW